MTALLFADLPEQRAGPITVGPHTLLDCAECKGTGYVASGGHSEWADESECANCNGGGQVLVRTP